jgi:hypothetical protein
MYVTFVLFSSIFSKTYPPTMIWPRTTFFSSGHGQPQDFEPMYAFVSPYKCWYATDTKSL